MWTMWRITQRIRKKRENMKERTYEVEDSIRKEKGKGKVEEKTLNDFSGKGNRGLWDWGDCESRVGRGALGALRVCWIGFIQVFSHTGFLLVVLDFCVILEGLVQVKSSEVLMMRWEGASRCICRCWRRRAG